jgi:epoxyqueuosine reductase QueG
VRLDSEMTKEDITIYARDIGAALVGFAPASRWEEGGELDAGFRPSALWPMVKTVISICVPSLLPIVETRISDLYRAQYDIVNRVLDEITYLLAMHLNRHGVAAIPICRDGYGEQRMLRKNPTAAFSHVWAAYYAGLGTIGWNHTLITNKYGPRHRLASVFTAIELDGDPIIERELCPRCRICEVLCPERVYSGSIEDRTSLMDKIACAEQTFEGPYNHCGFCIKICPVGEDRKLFKGASTKEYAEAHRDVAKWKMGVFANIERG